MPSAKILMIDDDNDFVAATKVVLKTKGYEVYSAQNKEEGLEQIRQIMPDLIIMDVMMQKMSDGFDLSRKLKNDEKFKDIPILILTSLGDRTGFKFSGESVDKLWLPVDDYAEKPLKPEELLGKVEKLLSR